LDHIPIIPNLHQKMEECTRPEGALNMGEWHTCETTHCRAGWAITLAGPAGKVLEGCLGPATAGALLYFRSTGSIPDFYARTAAARADIERCAKEAT
jgi:hypothetical protein